MTRSRRRSRVALPPRRERAWKHRTPDHCLHKKPRQSSIFWSKSTPTRRHGPRTPRTRTARCRAAGLTKAERDLILQRPPGSDSQRARWRVSAHRLASAHGLAVARRTSKARDVDGRADRRRHGDRHRRTPDAGSARGLGVGRGGPLPRGGPRLGHVAGRAQPGCPLAARALPCRAGPDSTRTRPWSTRSCPRSAPGARSAPRSTATRASSSTRATNRSGAPAARASRRGSYRVSPRSTASGVTSASTRRSPAARSTTRRTSSRTSARRTRRRL